MRRLLPATSKMQRQCRMFQPPSSIHGWGLACMRGIGAHQLIAAIGKDSHAVICFDLSGQTTGKSLGWRTLRSAIVRLCIPKFLALGLSQS